MGRTAVLLAAALALACASAGSDSAKEGRGTVEAPRPPRVGLADRLADVRRGELRVTQGKVTEREGALLVESPKMRAVALQKTPPVAELAFTYLGPTKASSKLASGAERRQLGLKLRAADGCNLVYVMWRIDPQPGLVVSIKRNPGATTSAECGAHGYRNVRPIAFEPVGRPEIGKPYVLRAALEGERLEVLVDGRSVWKGDLGPESLTFDGPVGLRTDNARVSFSLRAP